MSFALLEEDQVTRRPVSFPSPPAFAYTLAHDSNNTIICQMGLHVCAC